MFDFLRTIPTPPVPAGAVLLRLVSAFVLGWIVAWVYRRTRHESRVSSSLQSTLVLLSILIATVTQVVGESPARAFSLVGALSIIRFRTVVQDTEDTAFVIFAVVMGMAAGANAPWMAVIGLGVVTAAAFVMRPRMRGAPIAAAPVDYLLTVRVGLGFDVDTLVKAPFAIHLSSYHLASMETTRHDTAIDASYAVVFRGSGSAEGLLKTLNHVEGIQKVHLKHEDFDDD